MNRQFYSVDFSETITIQELRRRPLRTFEFRAAYAIKVKIILQYTLCYKNKVCVYSNANDVYTPWCIIDTLLIALLRSCPVYDETRHSKDLNIFLWFQVKP